MGTLDSLPEDQRAVLALVLQRGRGYDEIARMLSIDRAAVRERALAAFDSLGPQTSISEQRRALITDYLLGQLPSSLEGETRDRLSESAQERAWARVVASELAPLASRPLPEIPAGTTPAAAPAQTVAPAPAAPLAGAGAAAAAGEAERQAERDRANTALGSPPPPAPEPSGGSRVGGIILLVGGALVAIAVVVVVVLLVSGSSSSKHSNTSPTVAAKTSTASGAASGTSTSSATSTAATPVAAMKLVPPTNGSKAAGFAEVVKVGTNHGIEIVAQHITPNTKKPPNAYAVWLYNSSADAHLLGFVNPGVSKNGRLETAGGLPSNASHYKHVIITLETKANPRSPGTIVLAGPLNGLS